MKADGEALPPALEDGAENPTLPEGLHRPILLMAPVEVHTRAVRANVSAEGEGR